MNIRKRVVSAVAGSALALAALSLAGCGDGTMTETRLQPEGLRVGEVVRAVSAPTAYRGGVYRQEIGPAGGTLFFGVGSLTFPPGALGRPTTITAAVDGATIAANFAPHGLTFPIGANPRLTFRAAPGSGVRPQILYIDGDSRILEALPTIPDRLNGTVAAQLRHFSPYILAQN